MDQRDGNKPVVYYPVKEGHGLVEKEVISVLDSVQERPNFKSEPCSVKPKVFGHHEAL